MNIYQYLVVADFDATLADTFIPSPNNINVIVAYEKAIESIFGREGLAIFKEIGGLQNRAPMELVADLLRNGDEEKMMKRAGNFYESENINLMGLVPQGKGADFNWRIWDPIGTITETLIRCKLRYLIKEIGAILPGGKKWPLPCLGVLEFFEAIKALNQNGKIDIKLAIISSGHDEFIKKTFVEAWGLPCPSILVTDDDMRRLAYPVNPREKVKPSVSLFNLVHLMWFTNQIGPIFDNLQLIKFVVENRKRMIYFGDDPIKDGQLAEAAEVPFGWFSSGEVVTRVDLARPVFSFSDWKKVAESLSSPVTIELFSGGRPFSEIILPLC